MLCYQPLTIFAKPSILDVWQGSEYASGNITKVLYKKKHRKISRIRHLVQTYNYLWNHSYNTLHLNQGFLLF